MGRPARAGPGCRRRADRARRARHAAAGGGDAALRQRARPATRTHSRPDSAASSSWPSPATSSAGRRSRRSPGTGLPDVLVGLVVEGRGIARHGHPVWVGDRRTGVVTSGTQSPTLGVPIAMAYVAPADAEPGTVVDVEIRDARVPARVVALPFYTEGCLIRWCRPTCATPRTTSGSASRATRRRSGSPPTPPTSSATSSSSSCPDAGSRPRAVRRVRCRRIGQGGQRPVRAGQRRGGRGERRARPATRSSSTATRTAPAGCSASGSADAGQVDGLLDADAYDALIAAG